MENLDFDPISAIREAVSGNEGNVLNTEDTRPAENSTPEEIASNIDGVKESLDKIFSAVIVGGLSSKTDAELAVKKAEVFKQAMNKFVNDFAANIFEDEYAVLHSALTTLKVRVFSEGQLMSLMDFSADDILGSTKIHLERYSSTASGGEATEEEKIAAFKLDVKDKFNKLSKSYVTYDEFETACAVYKLYFREKFMADMSQAMAMIMSEGMYEKVGKGRNRLWKGADDCREYYNQKINILDSIDNASGIKDDELVNEDWLSDELSEETLGETPIVLDTGIKEIDDVYGGLIRGNMFEVMGPPKGGKTTLTQYLVDRALERGLNVAVWPLEGTSKEWTAALIALMVRKKEGISVNKSKIKVHKYSSEKEKQAVIAAKAELAMGEKRGKLSFIRSACYVETMRDVLNNHWKEKNPFDVLVVDSPILALSLKGKSRTDTAAEAYTTLKHYISYELVNKAVALVTCQLKQTVIDEIRSNPEAEVDVTAGGVTSETIRTPDFVVCLLSTKEERKMGQVRIHDVASRHSESFDTFYVGADLGSAYFYSDSALNET